MSKLVDKIAGALGFSPEYEEEEYEEYEEVEQPKVSTRSERRSSTSTYEAYRSMERERYEEPMYETSASRSGNQRRPAKVVNLHANVQMEVVVASPESLKEAMELSRNIKDNKPVVVNLEFIDHSMAQRITDFLCGCCCALNGNIQRIADKIFMIAPDNVDFAGDIDIRETLENEGGLVFPWGTDR